MRYSKYHAKKVTDPVYGTFDSAKEFKRFIELKNLEKIGAIKNLSRQIEFVLIEKQELKEPRIGKNGRTQKTERAVKYIADFTYWRGDKYIVEDVKGMKTPEYLIKRKLMLSVYGIQIYEV